MLRKCAILGVVLLVLGGLAFARLQEEIRSEQEAANAQSSTDALRSTADLESYGRWYKLTPEEQNQLVLKLDKDRQSKTPEELLAERQNRLKADLDRLASGDLNAGDLAEYLYGPNWQDEVAQHRKRKEQQQITQTTAIVCLSIGGTLFVGCTFIWICGALIRGLRSIRVRRRRDENEEDQVSPELTHIHHEEPEPEEEEAPQPQPKQRKRLSDEASYSIDLPDQESEGQDHEQEPEPFEPKLPNRRRSLATETAPDEGVTAVLLADEPSEETEWSPEMEWPSQVHRNPNASIHESPEHLEHSSEILDAPEAIEPEDPLREQAENLQVQIAEFKEMAQSVQQATREQSAPLNNTLKELAQQVSAIREYAASQQDRVEKLQEGYDWNIIRTFCLRVIRCLDNIEYRITRLGDDDDATPHLEEVRDELLFALESSGIEQYRPEINSDYRGQEKQAEAVKEKEIPQEPDQAGRIAKVVRPGYRYMIDEDNAKIVRTAQVKLFG